MHLLRKLTSVCLSCTTANTPAPCCCRCCTGKPLFGTLIALLHNGQPVLGVIDQPITRERWVGVAGSPSTLNGRPIATRPCGDIGNAYMYATTPHMFAGKTEEVGRS
jgi:fructose-1,6-bisphosphatase/inositol monophosphatase family enzyme